MATRCKWSKKLFIVISLMVCMLLSTSCKKEERINIQVSAASSLTQVVTDIIKEYETNRPEVKIIPNFAGTNTLKMQILEGADVDLFLSANEKYYNELDEAGYIEQGAEFARNQLCAIKHKDNKNVTTLEDIASPGLQVIIGHEDVPVGSYTLQVLNKLDQVYGHDYLIKTLHNVVSRESNVKRIVTKINLGEGDVGFVYKTDIIDSVRENIVMIPIEEQYNVMSHYYVGILQHDEIKPETKALYDYIFSDEAKKIIEKYGFEIDKEQLKY